MFALVYGGRRRPCRRPPRASSRWRPSSPPAHWDVVKRRDADLTYNLRAFADLPAEAPGFDWAGWVAGARRSPGDRLAELVVRQPDYLTAFAALWAGADLEDWKRWAALAADPRARRSCSPTIWSPRTSRSTAARSAAPRRSATAGSAASSLVESLMGDARRQALRRAALPARRQGPDGRTGGQPARGLPASASTSWSG